MQQTNRCYPGTQLYRAMRTRLKGEQQQLGDCQCIVLYNFHTVGQIICYDHQNRHKIGDCNIDTFYLIYHYILNFMYFHSVSNIAE